MADAARRPASILLVEDDEQNLELVEFLLEEAGLEVRVARDSEGARAAALGPPPDVVLLDMQLPGADGLALARELRLRPGWDQVPLVALTAAAMRGDRERFLAGGCTGYVAKPIDVSTFVATVLGFVPPKAADGTP